MLLLFFVYSPPNPDLKKLLDIFPNPSYNHQTKAASHPAAYLPQLGDGFDHISDHRQPRSTRKQWRQELRKASVSGVKPTRNH